MDFLHSTFVAKRFVINNETYTSVKGKIGEGAFAYVSRAKNSKGKDFAVKRIVCTTEEQEREARKEIDTIKRLQAHINIIPFFGDGTRVNKNKQQEILLLMPFYKQGTILSICEKGPGYPNSAFSD